MSANAAASLPDDLLAAMSARGNVRKFAPQAILFSEGDPSDAVYVLLEGRVKVFGTDAEGHEVIYNTLGPGESFGEVALDGGPRSASVMTPARPADERTGVPCAAGAGGVSGVVRIGVAHGRQVIRSPGLSSAAARGRWQRR